MKKVINYLIVSLIIISSIFMYFSNKEEYLSSDDIIGVYVNDELSDKMPAKDEALFQKAICDDENAKVTWDSDSWGLLISNLSKKVKCNLYFYSGQTVFDFDYTGDEQTFTVPFSGTYKLETWGAEGGKNGTTYKTAFGGYSTGNIILKEANTIYVYVGSTDLRNCSSTQQGWCYGGYNGGGDSWFGNEQKWGSGGGATHMAITTGLLKSLENNKQDIIIVSGGGGGVYNVDGASGGGYVGNNGHDREGFQTAIGGSQISGGTGYTHGTFGQGGSCKEKGINCSGGGGGFYGGGSAGGIDGAGGSGYIGNTLLTNKAMYCYNCEESSEESTKTISTTCAEETPTSNCAKKGNGYARITLISIDE